MFFYTIRSGKEVSAMNKIDILIEQNLDNKSLCKRLKYVSFLYKEIATEENVESLDELIDILIEAYSGDKKENIKFKDDILDGFYRHLLKTGKKKSVAYDYMKRMDSICNSLGIAPKDVYYKRSAYSIDDLIGVYSFGGIKYEENVKKHNALSSALKRFKEYMDGDLERRDIDDEQELHLFLSYDEGYRSFENLNRHVCRFVVNDRECRITYKENRAVCGSITKIMSKRNFDRLIEVMYRYRGFLSTNKTPSFVQVPYGGVGSYEYEFAGKANHSGCFNLFEAPDRETEERAYSEFRSVIDDILAE